MENQKDKENNTNKKSDPKITLDKIKKLREEGADFSDCFDEESENNLFVEISEDEFEKQNKDREEFVVGGEKLNSTEEFFEKSNFESEKKDFFENFEKFSNFSTGKNSKRKILTKNVSSLNENKRKISELFSKSKREFSGKNLKKTKTRKMAPIDLSVLDQIDGEIEENDSNFNLIDSFQTKNKENNSKNAKNSQIFTKFDSKIDIKIVENDLKNDQKIPKNDEKKCKIVQNDSKNDKIDKIDLKIGKNYKNDTKIKKIDSKIEKNETKQCQISHSPFFSETTEKNSNENSTQFSPFNNSEINSNFNAKQNVKIDKNEIFHNGDFFCEGEKAKIFYWIDAFEDPFYKPGVVFVFGKTPEGKSVCLKVKNVKRKILFLLKEKVKKSNTVKKRLEEDLKSRKIKDFTLKFVTRKFCFRERKNGVPPVGNYLKCSYSFNQPEIEKDFSSKHIKKVFGVNSSAKELFILNRKLMGPSWLIIKSFSIQKSLFSWCKIEYEISSPKNVKVLSKELTKNIKCENLTALQNQLEISPKMAAMSISLGTITEKGETQILCISAVICSAINVEKSEAKNINSRSVSHFFCLRPIKGESVPKDLNKKIKSQKRNVRVCSSEREMLNFFLAKIMFYDPDILVAHNLTKYHIPLLLKRMHDLKVNNWSRICRLKKTKMILINPVERGLACGRLFADTWLLSSEFLNDKMLSLSYLAKNHLNIQIEDLSQDTLRKNFNSTEKILYSAGTLSNNSFAALKLLVFISALPLTRQLSILCGNLWSRSLLSKRAERIEYLLLHEFSEKKYIVPEKLKAKQTQRSRKAGYCGGLVLEPIKGFYDNLIVLLDFASLYPSIIKEYNICFTTLKHWEDEIDEKELNTNLKLKSILPVVLDRLLERRKNIKKIIKTTTEKSLLQKLDIRQRAVKLVANSIYGCLGFESSRFYCQPMASIITKLGRKHLSLAKEKAEALFPSGNVKVIYGDTDSIMVSTREKSYAKAKKIASEILTAVNKPFKHMELELDGVFRNLLLLQKKKYAATAILSEENGVFKTKVETKGLDLVRRDWCPLSKEIGTKILKEILSTKKTREEIVKNVQSILVETKEKIEGDLIPPQKFIITKSLTKPPSCYADANAHPHVVVALSMIKSGMHVSSGDHIPYVIAFYSSNTEKLRKNCENCDKNIKNNENNENNEKIEKNCKNCNKNSENKQNYDNENKENINENKREKNYSGKNILSEKAVYWKKFYSERENYKIDKKWYLTHQIFPPISRLCTPIPELNAGVIAHSLGISKTPAMKTALINLTNQNDSPNHFFSRKNGRLVASASAFQNHPEVFRLPLSCRRGCKLGKWLDIFVNFQNNKNNEILQKNPKNNENLQKNPKNNENLQKNPNFCQNNENTKNSQINFALICPSEHCGGKSLLEGEEDVARFKNAVLDQIRNLRRELYSGWTKCDGVMCGQKTVAVFSRRCPSGNCSGNLNYDKNLKTVWNQILYYNHIFDLEKAIERNSGEISKNSLRQKVPIEAQKFLKELKNFSEDLLRQNEYNKVDLGHVFRALLD